MTRADAERRLRAFPLPGEHDIGIDSEERESKHGGINPFSGVTLRDDNNRLLGYIVYPLTAKSDADKLRQHLERSNRFHNVLVVYPDARQASIELWQGREQLTGKLRQGQSHKDAADVVNLLSRFFVVSRAKVRNPSELAQELAYRARYLRRLALHQLKDEPEKGPLRNLYNAFKVALVHDQTEGEFADAFAQTITYGLLTARWLGNDQLVTTGVRFTRQNALKYLPAASPLLSDLFKSALSLKLDEHRGRLLWLVDDVADLLDFFALDVNTSAILLYLEAVKDARKFMSAARAAARLKPVIVVKSGRMAQGAKAAATHTGALAGSSLIRFDTANPAKEEASISLARVCLIRSDKCACQSSIPCLIYFRQRLGVEFSM